MDPQVQYWQTAKEVASRLVQAVPGIEAIVLYGSVARGEAGEDSDIDLLVLTSIPARPVEEQVRALVSGLDAERRTFTQAIVETVEEYRSRVEMGYPLERTAARMGQALYDRGAFASVRAALAPRTGEEKGQYGPLASVVAEYLGSADEALAEAGHLLSGGFWDGASSRAYYAMFYAASAAVLSAGIEEIRSHKALVGLFRRTVAIDRRVGLEYAGDLERALKTRLNADYAPGFRVDEAAAWETVAAATRFIARIRELLASG
jgi:uncharacterized protein (UPF0332 family)/predicted nucleotidyltransferase